MTERVKDGSHAMQAWNDGTGSLFTEEIPGDETVKITDDRYLGEYRGEGWQVEGWIGPGLSEAV